MEFVVLGVILAFLALISHVIFPIKSCFVKPKYTKYK